MTVKAKTYYELLAPSLFPIFLKNESSLVSRTFINMRDFICCVKQLATLRTMCFLVLLPALLITSTSAWGVKHDQVVVNAMRDMASNWNGFKGLFAETAIVKFCKQGEACQEGSFDDLFGPFEDAVKLVYVEHSVLMEGSTSAFLHHWTQYVETHSGCQDTWAGYSSYEFDAKGRVERLVVYLEKSKEVLSCVAKAKQAAEAEQKAEQASQA
jgi:hypothetical protein